jgi:integrase
MARGRDGLFLRAGVFGFRYKDGNGNWPEKSTGSHNRAEARKIKRQFEEDLKAGAVPDKQWSELTVREAAGRWLKACRGEVDPNTYRSYKSNLSAPVAFFADRRLRNFSLADIRFYRNSRLEAVPRPIHPRTINHEVTALSWLLGEANVWKKIVAAGYTALSMGKRHSSRLPLAPEELNHLVITGMTNPTWEVVLYTMLIAAESTARPCEIMGLQLGRIHVDGDYPYITIHRKTTKTDSGARDLPLNNISLLAVRKLLYRAQQLGANKPDHYLLPRDLSRHTKADDPLYSRRFDGWDPALGQRSWAGSWAALRTKAGLPDIEFYQLRATAITTGQEEDVPIAVMAALSGHSSEQMTDYYTTVRNDPKRRAVEAIEKSNPELLDILGLPREHDDDAKPKPVIN